MQIDTALAQLTLPTLDSSTGAVTPPNMMHNKTSSVQSPSLIHITADNIDIIPDTLDGKKSFHATQVVAFQRGAQTTDEIFAASEGNRY